MKSNLPFGAPDFSRIKESDYLPAIEAAIKIKRDNIQKIVDNKKKPTFQNTILAFEESGILLDRVCSVFFGLTNADKTPVLAEAEDKVMPLLTGCVLATSRSRARTTSIRLTSLLATTRPTSPSTSRSCVTLSRAAYS